MTEFEQPKLPFDSESQSNPPEVEETASCSATDTELGRVAAFRVVEYPDRTSEAAHDQGWGPVELPSEDEVHAASQRHPAARRTARPIELPRRGRTNAPHVRPENLSDEQKAINARGFENVRRIMRGEATDS